MRSLKRLRRSWPLLCALFVSTLCTQAACGAEVEPPLEIAQYAHTSWTARDNARLGMVFAMAQTPDGYLWLASSFGMFRFDGVHFAPWHPPAAAALSSAPYALLAAKDGSLWIGTFAGLFKWDGQELRQYPGVGGDYVTSIFEDRDGTVWVGTLSERGRLCSIRGETTNCLSPQGGFGNYVWSISGNRDGGLWVAAETGIWSWREGRLERTDGSVSRAGDLITTGQGETLLGVRGGGLRRIVGGRLRPYQAEAVTAAGRRMTDFDIRANKLLKARDGSLWIGSEGRGLIHLQDGRLDTFTRADGLSGNVACSLFEDREGNIWFASERGIDRFSRVPVTTISVRQGLPSEATLSVIAGSEGGVWVGTREGLVRWRDGRRRVFTMRDGLPDTKPQSLYQSPDGSVWVSTSRGLARLKGDRFVAVGGQPGREVYSMSGDRDGNLWLSGKDGLARLVDGRRVDMLPWTALGRNQQAKVVIADRGGVWLSFWKDGGVMFYKDGEVRERYLAGQGLGNGPVAGLRLDLEGAVWAATQSGGLSRIQGGRVRTLSTSNGLACNTIHWSVTDRSGALWIYAACGLMRISQDDFTAWIRDPGHRVTPRLWGPSDGIPVLAASPAYFNPPVALSADGRIWFVSGADLQMFDPEHFSSNPLPPPVHIVGLVADHKAYPVKQDLALPPQVRDLSFEFAGLSLVDPAGMAFRYRLDGHDSDWKDAEDRRQASYTNLPPGHYRFHVKASNNSGVWNEQGAELAFEVLPALHQTTWFRVIAAASLGGLAMAAGHLWLRRRIHRLRRDFEATLDARLAERTRIARDLHDTLLQRFHGLLLQFQAAANLLPGRAVEARQVLLQAIDRTAEAVTEGRDIVQGLRTVTPDQDDLARALDSFADDLWGEAGPENVDRPRISVLGTPRALRAVVRDESFRIAAEALRNAIHHADAKQIQVEIDYATRVLTVTVRDDGRGIDPGRLQSEGIRGHFGIQGMRERAEIASGRLRIESRPGAGTVITFEVPAERAYDAVPAASPRSVGGAPASFEVRQ